MNDNVVNETVTAQPAAEQLSVPTLKIHLTLDEVNLVLAGLGELPAKTSMSLIDKVRSQGMIQLQQLQQAQQTQAQPGTFSPVN